MANNPEEGMEFLSVKEVSRILRIPLRTAYRLANQGRIRSIRIGGRLRCYREDVEKCSVFGTGIPSKSLGGRKEKRAHPRINSNFDCKYSVNLTPYKDISGAGLVKNISAGGVFLDNGCKDIAVDDPIEIKFDLGDIRGRIIRKGENGVAVKFRDLDGEVENRIIRYVG